MSRIKEGPTWMLSTQDQVEHFKEWNELYGPSLARKLFAIKTEYYLDADGVRCHVNKVVAWLIDYREPEPDEQ